MILSIGWREFRSLFLSPLAWAILAVIQLILGYFFLVHSENYVSMRSQLLGSDDYMGLTQMVVAPLFGTAAVIALLLVPIITMRLVSEERRSKTLALLYSAPVSMTEIILGKYLGILLFLAVMLAMIVIMPLSLLIGGTLDFGLFISGVIGLSLVLASFAAVGLFTSTLTQHPTVAGISCFGILLLFWIIGQTDDSAAVFTYLSLTSHYEPFLRGIVSSTDAIYYLLFITTFLVLGIRRLDTDRMGG